MELFGSTFHALGLAGAFSFLDYITSLLGIRTCGLAAESNSVVRWFYRHRGAFMYFIIQFFIVASLFLLLIEFGYEDVVFVVAYMIFLLPAWNVIVTLINIQRMKR